MSGKEACTSSGYPHRSGCPAVSRFARIAARIETAAKPEPLDRLLQGLIDGHQRRTQRRLQCRQWHRTGTENRYRKPAGDRLFGTLDRIRHGFFHDPAGRQFRPAVPVSGRRKPEQTADRRPPEIQPAVSCGGLWERRPISCTDRTALRRFDRRQPVRRFLASQNFGCGRQHFQNRCVNRSRRTAAAATPGAAQACGQSKGGSLAVDVRKYFPYPADQFMLHIKTILSEIRPSLSKSSHQISKSRAKFITH